MPRWNANEPSFQSVRETRSYLEPLPPFSSSGPPSSRTQLCIMNHSCRKQAGVPSVTVRPDMFGFVQGGPADSRLLHQRISERPWWLICVVLPSGAWRMKPPNEVVFCWGFFCFFFPQRSSIKPTSHFHLFIHREVRREQRNRLQAGHVTWIFRVIYSWDVSCCLKAGHVTFTRIHWHDMVKPTFFFLFFFFKWPSKSFFKHYPASLPNIDQTCWDGMFWVMKKRHAETTRPA